MRRCWRRTVYMSDGRANLYITEDMLAPFSTYNEGYMTMSRFDDAGRWGAQKQVNVKPPRTKYDCIPYPTLRRSK